MEAHPGRELATPKVWSTFEIETRKSRFDAALGHEAGEATAHVCIGCPDRDHEVRVVDQVEERGQTTGAVTHGRGA